MSISAAELASIRNDVAAMALDQTCVIQRKAITRDIYGTETEVWNTVATVQAGMTEPTAGMLSNYDYLIGDLAAWHVRLPYGTSVQHQDRLLIAGETLVVQVILTPRSYEILRSVIASEVK